jgi:PEP-CTERM motif
MQTRKLGALAAILGGAVALAAPANAQETFKLQTIASTGTNTSQLTGQTLDLSDATNAPLFGAALTAFNAKNSDTVRQNATSFTLGVLGGQLVGPQFFPFGGPSVPVYSNVAVTGHLTATGTAGSVNYFNFAETAGAQIVLYGAATSPPNQGTELLLNDNNGNLVAVASGNGPDGLSSIIDFTVPDGDAGEWQTAITQGFSTTSAINYRLQFQMPYTALSQFTTNVIGSGQEGNGSLGAYDVSAAAGDNLSFDVHATPPLTGTELLLFDPNGNLVAVASGNGSDGLSSIIDFTVLDGDTGEWQIAVEPDPNVSSPQPYPYDLAIQGFSGLGPVNPSAVPEPGAWALLLLGFAGVGAARRVTKRRYGLRL